MDLSAFWSICRNLTRSAAKPVGYVLGTELFQFVFRVKDKATCALANQTA